MKQKVGSYINKMGNKILRSFIEMEQTEGEPFTSLDNFIYVL